MKSSLKPDYDPIADTSRPTLRLKAATVHQVRALCIETGLTPDEVINGLMVIRGGLREVMQHKASRRKLQRVLKELCQTLGK